MVNRRQFISAVSSVGVIGAAGCLTEDDNGSAGASGEFIFATTGEGGSMYPAAQGLGTAIGENTDLTIDTRPSDGTDANMGLLDRNEADITLISLETWNNFRENNEPFDELDVEIQQLTHFVSLSLTPIIRDDMGWDTLEDMEPGTELFPSPLGSGSARLVEYALEEHITDDFEFVPTGLDGSASALAEGEIDLVMGGVINGELPAPNVQEIGPSVDSAVLEMPIEEMGDDPNLEMSEGNSEILEDIGGYVSVPDPVHYLDMTYSVVVEKGHNDDDVYDFVESMHELRGDLDEYHAALAPFEDEEHMLNAPMQDLPFHPAAADYYEDTGIWNDDLIRGD
jgi:uncharacterized protein